MTLSIQARERDNLLDAQIRIIACQLRLTNKVIQSRQTPDGRHEANEIAERVLARLREQVAALDDEFEFVNAGYHVPSKPWMISP